MRAGVQIAEIMMREGHHMPDGARKTITFLVGEAYSYGPNVLVDLEQAIRVKANAALKLIIANVPVEGPKYTGTILNESQDLLLEKTNGQRHTQEFQQKIEDAMAEIEELRTRNQELQAELAVMGKYLAVAQTELEGLRSKNMELEAMIAARSTLIREDAMIGQSEEASEDEDRISLATDEQVLDAIELVAQSTLLKDTNQHMRCQRVFEVAIRDGRRGKRFTTLARIIEGIRDGTFDRWVEQLQGEGVLTHKSAGLFLTLKSFLVSEGVFGDGNNSVSIPKIRGALIPLLIKRGYDVLLG